MSTTTNNMNNTMMNSVNNCYEQLLRQEKNARDYFINYITHVVRTQYNGKLEVESTYIELYHKPLIRLMVTDTRVLMFGVKGDYAYMSINLQTRELYEIANLIACKYDKYAED